MLGRLKKNGVLSKELTWFCCVSLAVALVIGCVDANGAGILIRYGCDVSFGIFLAAVVAVLGAAKAARQKKGLWPVCRLAEGSDFLSGSGVVSDFGQ